MVESVRLVSTPVEEHKHGGGSREEKDLAVVHTGDNPLLLQRVEHGL